MINIKEFDGYLSENGYLSAFAESPDKLIVHPDRCTWGDNLEKVCLDTSFGIYCYKYFPDKEKYICMGEAMNLDDAKLWVLENKEIQMWT